MCCWSVPLSGPVLIFSHIIFHLSIDPSLQPPCNCRVKVSLNKFALQFNRNCGNATKKLPALSGLAVGSWNDVAPLKKFVSLLLYAPPGKYIPKLPRLPGPKRTRVFSKKVLQMKRGCDLWFSGIILCFLWRHISRTSDSLNISSKVEKDPHKKPLVDSPP